MEDTNSENEGSVYNPVIKILSSGGLELSYDEYEKVKKQIMEAFDKTFKPRPEKLN